MLKSFTERVEQQAVAIYDLDKIKPHKHDLAAINHDGNPLDVQIDVDPLLRLKQVNRELGVAHNQQCTALKLALRTTCFTDKTKTCSAVVTSSDLRIHKDLFLLRCDHS